MRKGSKVLRPYKKWMTIEQRFWPKVKKDGPIILDTPCWVWTGSCHAEGYGHFRLENRIRKASQVSFELENGPIPIGLLVLHKCDNPPCVRPDHLFLGTDKDNVHDCIKKGRFKPYGFTMKKDRK